MSIVGRKERERMEREQRIVVTAREIAEREGWEAVTIRRLAKEIEYSQPVLYSHFDGKDAIVAAVALAGFAEITGVFQEAAERASTRGDALANVAAAYLGFAFGRPALYQAMFVLPTGLRFAKSDTPPALRSAFDALAAVIEPYSDNAELLTETFWAALHGLAELERSGRIRPSQRDARIALVVRAIVA